MCSKAECTSNSNSGNRPLKSTIENLKLTIVHYAVDAGHFFKIAIHTFDNGRHLLVFETQKSIFFNHFGKYSH